MFLIRLLLSSLVMLFRAFVVCVLWDWFLKKLFPSLPSLQVLGVIGAIWIYHVATWNGIIPEDFDDEAALKSTFMQAFYAVLVLGLAWLTHFWV